MDENAMKNIFQKEHFSQNTLPLDSAFKNQNKSQKACNL